MKLFHYTTLPGRDIHIDGMIYPSNKYLLNSPYLVWLTENPDWEVSVLGPTHKWKFEVEIREPLLMMHYPVKGWVDMIEHYRKLGSDVSKWKWTTRKVAVVNSFRWVNNEWRIQE